jgi:uncharacterized membrane protein YccC
MVRTTVTRPLRSARANLAARDANRRALRRGLRVALVVPLTLAVFTRIPWLNQGALFAVFACLTLLTFADFGGSLRKRFFSYLATTATGIPLITLGAFASQTVWSSVMLIAVVAMLVGMVGVLRGPVTSAQSGLLLGTVVALTASSPEMALVDAVAWTLGGLIAAVSAVVLWPAHADRPIRRKLAQTLDAVAQAVSARWGPQADPVALDAARSRLSERIEELHELYDGDLARPSGATNSERALASMVDEVARLRYMQKWEDVSARKDERLLTSAHDLAAVVVDGLSRCADRLRTGGADLDTWALLKARERNLSEVTDWLASQTGSQPATTLREQIDDMFPLRITNVVTARISDQTIALQPVPSDRPAGSDHSVVSVQTKPPSKRQRLIAHASWDSPWFRNALRSAVALSLSIALAKSLTVEHPFWIVLGTLSALRFDALGTGRTARQALVGTASGVLISAGLILTFGQDARIWWVIFPFALFLAAYTPGTFSLAVGQAAFSLVVIVMFSILGPARLETATARVVDVALGLAISLIVSLLMWPRGVVQTLNKRFIEAMTAACDLYVASVDWMAGGAIDDRLLADFQRRSFIALDRAAEALDLSVAQRPPQAIDLSRWAMLANTVGHVDFAARLTTPAAAMVTHGKVVPDALVGPLLTGANDVRRRLIRATERGCAEVPTTEVSTTPPPQTHDTDFVVSPAVINQRRSIDAYLSTSQGSDPRPVVIIWMIDWTAMLDRDAQVLERALV